MEKCIKMGVLTYTHIFKTERKNCFSLSNDDGSSVKSVRLFELNGENVLEWMEQILPAQEEIDITFLAGKYHFDCSNWIMEDGINKKIYERQCAAGYDQNVFSNTSTMFGGDCE